MLNIQKAQEPASFTRHRCQQNSSYKDIPAQAREDLQRGLLKEQGYLCAYCMARISAETMKIEHVLSRKEHPEDQLKYANLVACCPGNEGRPPNEQHCDTAKGQRSLSKNPAVPGDRVQESIRYYPSSGEIYSENSTFNTELNKTLHLNLSELCNNRKSIFEAVQHGLDSLPTNAPRQRIQRLLDIWEAPDAQGRLKEYAGAAIFILKKRLGRAR